MAISGVLQSSAEKNQLGFCFMKIFIIKVVDVKTNWSEKVIIIEYFAGCKTYEKLGTSPSFVSDINQI